MLLSLLMTSWLVSPVVASQNTAEAATPVDENTEFLLQVRILESRPEDGEIELLDPDGKPRLLREGDVLEEAGGARIKDVGRSTLVLSRAAEGIDGSSGESLVVVRFDETGKTRVREYREIPDVSLSEPRPPNDR